MAKETKYEMAISQLEEIVERLENNQLGIDEMTAQLKRRSSLSSSAKTVSPRPTRRFRKSSAKERTNKHKEIQRLKLQVMIIIYTFAR